MNIDLLNAQLLEQEHWAIELLARETHATIPRVQELFLEEYTKLAERAHIKAFLPLLTGNRVRVILSEQNARLDEAPKP